MPLRLASQQPYLGPQPLTHLMPYYELLDKGYNYFESPYVPLPTRANLAAVDLEFTPDLTPTEVSIVVRAKSHTNDKPRLLGRSTYWSQLSNHLAKLISNGCSIVGHNWQAADEPIIEAHLGVSVPLERQYDTILLHYLANQALTKGTEEKDPYTGAVDYQRGQGFMSLATVQALYTDVPFYKQCRGDTCNGPCPTHQPSKYNLLDSAVPLLALPGLLSDLERKKVPLASYRHLQKLNAVMIKMSKLGIPIDRTIAAQVEHEIKAEKEDLFTYEDNWLGRSGKTLKTPKRTWDSPFDPTSPKQIVEYLKTLYIATKTSTRFHTAQVGDLERLIKRARRVPKILQNHKRQFHWLCRLVDWKDVGTSLDKWFGPGLVGSDSCLHPRWICYGGAMNRPVSSRPNVQNFPKHNMLLAKGRKAIKALPGEMFISADGRQIEFRVIMWGSGIDPSTAGDDVFTWMLKRSQVLLHGLTNVSVTIHDPYLRNPRNVLKQAIYALLYGEGVNLRSPRELESYQLLSHINNGSLLAYPDWEINNKLVTFTGVNLAQRLYKRETKEARKDALTIQKAITDEFPFIREFQKRITTQACQDGYVNFAGRYLDLYCDDQKNFKDSLAFCGQGGGAISMSEAVVRMDAQGHTPRMFIHDDIGLTVPATLTDGQIHEIFAPMALESKLMPGFSCPYEAFKGPDYYSLEPISERG